MAQALIQFSEEEEDNISKYQKLWKIPKYLVIKRMIKEFMGGKKWSKQKK